MAVLLMVLKAFVNDVFSGMRQRKNIVAKNCRNTK